MGPCIHDLGFLFFFTYLLTAVTDASSGIRVLFVCCRTLFLSCIRAFLGFFVHGTPVAVEWNPASSGCCQTWFLYNLCMSLILNLEAKPLFEAFLNIYSAACMKIAPRFFFLCGREMHITVFIINVGHFWRTFALSFFLFLINQAQKSWILVWMSSRKLKWPICLILWDDWSVKPHDSW